MCKVKTQGGSKGKHVRDRHGIIAVVCKIAWKAMYLERSDSVSIHTHGHSQACIDVTDGGSCGWYEKYDGTCANSRGLLSLS